ncbi:hypothetical protein [Streptomyces sp. NPDC005955]|uniref:hypothetical protein n=1 Tax=Streptomyces sp. NPDC005955 TaxID=3364738 RepID=UPI0036CFA208
MDAVSVTAAVVLPPFLLAAIALSVWKTARGLPTRQWRRPRWWVFPAVLLVVAGCVTWFIGTFSSGLDARETCLERGFAYDDAHRRDPSQGFPLHHWCNADQDLVPAFVNPSLVAIAVALLGCAAGSVAAAVAGRKKGKGGG